MQKTIVTLSFDDGREDTYRNAYNTINQCIGCCGGVIHVVTGYVDKTYLTDSWKSSKGPISIAQLSEMRKNGFEISSHGDKHISEKNDFEISRNKLKSWNLINDECGFSIPNSDLSGEEKIAFVNFAKGSGIKYIRGGRDKRSYTLISKIYYVLYNLLKIQWFYNKFNQYNSIDISNPKDIKKYELPSVVVRKEDNPKMILNYIKKNTDKNKWIILMLHSIQGKEEESHADTWCWDIKKFETLCTGLKELRDKQKIEVRTILDVINTLEG